MLKRLAISNYALIDTLDISFSKELNIVTGETGAGKSILLGALGLTLGNRADVSSLHDKAKKCIIEAQFNINAYNLKSFFDSNELDFEEVNSIRREITPE